MNIVIEGPDASGKSTLARILAERLGRKVVSSEGPGKYYGEINERIKRYSKLQNVIFDRHPVISDPIYSAFRVDAEEVDPRSIEEFYADHPFIIYCQGSYTLEKHVPKEHDDQKHLAMIEMHHRQIKRYYDTWAIDNAHSIYRMNDSVSFVTILRAVEQRFDPFRDIEDFHKKFDLVYNGKPRKLPKELAKLRQRLIWEEADEYDSWCDKLTTTSKQSFPLALEGAFDSLIDLVYVAMGTAYSHGFNFREGWKRVHEANMRKARAVSVFESRRDSTFDVIKPLGWKSPDLRDLVTDHEEPVI